MITDSSVFHFHLESQKQRTKEETKMFSLYFCWLLFCVAFFVHCGQTCNEDTEEESLAILQDFENYLSNIYGYYNRPSIPFLPNYYHPSVNQDHFDQYEGRIPVNREFQQEQARNRAPGSNYFGRDNADFDSQADESQVDQRSLMVPSLFNRVFSNSKFNRRPLPNFFNRFSLNRGASKSDTPLPPFNSCTSFSGEFGICSSRAVCSHFGGRTSGFCNSKEVCCINTVTNCGGSITLNNTYWQSPSTLSGSSTTCSLIVKLDKQLYEQKIPVCQVRIDFVSFAIAQPTADGDCTDSFRVEGAMDTVPPICGDNNDQHMYLEVPRSDTSPSNLQLKFVFGKRSLGNHKPTWNIKISILQCGASYLAPPSCLQYFTGLEGRFSSFNWKDTDLATGPRQLSKQLYAVCFRTEVIDSLERRANKLCLSVCTPATTGASSFFLSGNGTKTISGFNNSSSAPRGCHQDFLHFSSGTHDKNSADRFCGAAFSPADNGNNTKVCSPIKPFRITYITDENESGDFNNQGFCFDFNQS